ncbi:MAG: helix-turn-helix domain-containing protein [Chloroflexota bacterium]|nr:helix-turn-helix domain-containing protein [Chloroflexota bacterium]
MSIPQAAKMMGLAPSTVRGAVERGELPSVQLNRRRWVARTVVESVLTRAQSGGNSDAVTSNRYGIA